MIENKKVMIILILVGLLCFSTCDNELIEYRTNDLKISIEQGEEWLHDYPLSV